MFNFLQNIVVFGMYDIHGLVIASSVPTWAHDKLSLISSSYKIREIKT
jgi:hypothetical protein